MRSLASRSVTPRFLWETEEELGFLGFLGFPAAVLDALRSGPAAVAVRLAVGLGFRDENKLTNLVFFARHPERGGRKLDTSEPGFQALSREWLEIRDGLVRPALTPVVPSKPVSPVPTGGTLRYGVPGGTIISGYLKWRKVRYHSGIDVSPYLGKGGGADDPRRGAPVHATLRPTIEIATLNSVKVAISRTQVKTGLGIAGQGVATLKSVKVVTKAYSGKKEKRTELEYGGIAALEGRYTFLKNDGTPGVFTILTQYWHLITSEYLPKNGAGRILSLSEWLAAGKGDRMGFGPKMVDGALLLPKEFLTSPPPLVGYLGATQTPHVHIHCRYREGEQQPKDFPRLDPAVVIW